MSFVSARPLSKNKAHAANSTGLELAQTDNNRRWSAIVGCLVPKLSAIYRQQGNMPPMQHKAPAAQHAPAAQAPTLVPKSAALTEILTKTDFMVNP